MKHVALGAMGSLLLTLSSHAGSLVFAGQATIFNSPFGGTSLDAGEPMHFCFHIDLDGGTDIFGSNLSQSVVPDTVRGELQFGAGVGITLEGGLFGVLDKADFDLGTLFFEGPSEITPFGLPPGNIPDRVTLEITSAPDLITGDAPENLRTLIENLGSSPQSGASITVQFPTTSGPVFGFADPALSGTSKDVLPPAVPAPQGWMAGLAGLSGVLLRRRRAV